MGTNTLAYFIRIITKKKSFIRLGRLGGDKHPNLFKSFVRLEKLDRDKHPSLFHLEHHKKKKVL